MARRLFISFLGTSFYDLCTYYDSQATYSPTRFIQRATLEQIGAKTWTETDAVRIFVTEEANKLNWDKSQTTRQNRNKEEVPYARLQQELEDMGLKAEAKAVPVADGKDEKEMWEIFQTVYDEIEVGDELYIDLTHGFRYLPMFVLVLSNYAKFLKNVNVKHLSYGNWEAGDKKTGRAPIVDLLPLTMLQDWTNAASEFIKHGYAENLKKAILEELNPFLRDDKLRTENIKNVNKLGQSLVAFVEERIACRGIDISNGSYAKKLSEQLEEMKDSGIAPLNPIFFQLKKEIRLMGSKPAQCYDAAEWCFNRQLYQQAITLLQEGVNTMICIRNGINIEDEDRRDYVGQAFHIKDEEFKDDKKKKRNYSIEDNKYLSTILDDQQLQDRTFVNQYIILSGTRNDYNHAGFRKKREPLSPYQIKQKIKTALEFFKDYLTSEAHEGKDIPLAHIFLNLSNHPFADWSEEQKAAAKRYGEVVEKPFPPIPSDASKEEIEKLAEDIADEIMQAYPDTDLTVHVMGEMTFTYALVSRLKGCGVRCVASCSERVVQELGNGKRISQFQFEQFREY